MKPSWVNINEIQSTIDYYPFGMEMPGRMNPSSGSSYRFGMNGQMKDNEYTGQDGAHLNFEVREYDCRIGRWWSNDPSRAKYPSWSPYHFAANNPIYFVDVFGKDWGKPKITKDKNGNTTVIVRLTAAVLNTSSNTSYTTQHVTDVVKQQVENTYSYSTTTNGGSITVKVEVDIRPINSVDELKDNEHLYEIADNQYFSEGSYGHAEIYGKHIMLNADMLDCMMNPNFVPKDGGVFRNNRTVPHETGHTGGLIHPFEISSRLEKYFFYDQNQREQVNSEEKNDPQNVMNYGSWTVQPTISTKQLRILIENINMGAVNQDNIDKDEIKQRETD